MSAPLQRAILFLTGGVLILFLWSLVDQDIVQIVFQLNSKANPSERLDLLFFRYLVLVTGSSFVIIGFCGLLILGYKKMKG